MFLGALAALLVVPEGVVSFGGPHGGDPFRPYPFDLRLDPLRSLQMIRIGGKAIHFLQAEHLLVNTLLFSGVVVLLALRPKLLHAFLGPRTGRRAAAGTPAGRPAALPRRSSAFPDCPSVHSATRMQQGSACRNFRIIPMEGSDRTSNRSVVADRRRPTRRRAAARDGMLKDVLAPDLALVVCGSAAGRRSAELGRYYAGRGNKFWATLAETGLTPRRLAPHEYPLLPSFGIGLTDVVKCQAGGDLEVDFSRSDPEALRQKIRRFSPTYLCFNGKRAAKVFLGRTAVDFGIQTEAIGSTILFVAPSTSGAASGFWNVAFWQELARLVRIAG